MVTSQHVHKLTWSAYVSLVEPSRVLLSSSDYNFRALFFDVWFIFVFFYFYFYLKWLIKLSALQNSDDERSIKVHQASKYFFFHWVECSLALSKHIAPFSFFDQMLTFHNLQNLGKTNYHLFHDRVRRGVGLFLIWRHQLLCILNARKSVCDVNQEWTHAPFWLGRETNDGKYHLRDKKAIHL